MASRSIIKGVLAILVLLLAYFSIVGLISGVNFAAQKFLTFWYFILALALGFGIQVGLYAYLRELVKINSSKAVLAVSGTTSTIAMISCCAHCLANILPVLGITGIISLVGQYQIELFWIGLIFNFIGIIFIYSKIVSFKKHAG